MKRNDQHLENGSAILWSQQFWDGRYPSGRIRYRVPVRCGGCGQVRKVSKIRACSSGFTGLCRACAHIGSGKINIPRETLDHLYNEWGLSTYEIADRLGVDPTTVQRRMAEYEIEARPPTSVPRTLVPKEVLRHWSLELAYIVGMVATDGSLERGRNRVKFYSTDRQWVETYQACLRIEAPVQVTRRPFRKPLYTVAFSDPDYRVFLEGVGLTPGKSTDRTLGTLNIPDLYYRDFLRACVEGDGSISVSRQKGRYLQLRVGLVSCCRLFLEWVGETVERLTGLEATGLYRKELRTWVLEYYGSKGRRLLSWVYYTPGLPCLERKRAIWEKYLSNL